MSIAEVIGLVGMAVHAVRSIIDNKGTRTAEQVIDAIEKIFNAIDAAAVHKVTPDMAGARIQALMIAMKTNDAAADAELAARFPGDRV